MPDVLELLAELWPALAAGLTLLLAVVTAGHAILYKQDSRATVAWVGVIWLAPVIGAALYVLLGINRIKRRAAQLRQGIRRFAAFPRTPPRAPWPRCPSRCWAWPVSATP